MSFIRNYYIITQRKFKVIILLLILCLITATLIFLKYDRPYYNTINNDYQVKSSKILYHHGRLPQVIIPEKYNEHDIKTRLIQDKIQYLKAGNLLRNETGTTPILLHLATDASSSLRLHIFFKIDINWYKISTKTPAVPVPAVPSNSYIRTSSLSHSSHEKVNGSTNKLLTTAYYPALGYYKQTPNILRQQLQNLKNSGIGVIILDIDDINLYGDGSIILDNLFNLTPEYNISITFQIKINDLQPTIQQLQHQLLQFHQYFIRKSFYQIYSYQMRKYYAIIYVKNAYKLQYCNNDDKLICSITELYSKVSPNIILIGHIRSKDDAELMRRLCFNGFYTESASNGAYYASTWKNWANLNSFATQYNMLFIPTIGPGYKSMPSSKIQKKHNELFRDRSNGQYYGYAWRTAIINHIGFITINSYNNWLDGTQIEEAVPKTGYDNYSPGTSKRYLDLTTYWVNNFLITKEQLLSQNHENCYNFLNNTIC